MFAELNDEVPDGTASTPTVLFLEPDQGVHPLSQALPGAQFSKQLSLATQDRVVSRFGNSAKQVGLVVEVVVELAARRCGASADLIQARPDRAFLSHEVCRRLHDSLSGPASPLGSRLR